MNRDSGPALLSVAAGPAAISVAAGASVLCALALAHAGTLFSGLAAWDAGALTWLAIFGWLLRAGPERTRARAAAEDPGRAAVTALVVIGSGASLLSAVIIASSGDVRHVRVLVALSLANVALSWALTHAAFALRYAHLYYRDGDAEGGIDGGIGFPGDDPPAYADFAYLAFTVGMTFQVSDTEIASASIRRFVLAQALLAFVYNTAILAFVLNLVFGLA